MISVLISYLLYKYASQWQKANPLHGMTGPTSVVVFECLATLDKEVRGYGTQVNKPIRPPFDSLILPGVLYQDGMNRDDTNSR